MESRRGQRQQGGGGGSLWFLDSVYGIQNSVVNVTVVKVYLAHRIWCPWLSAGFDTRSNIPSAVLV